MSPEIQEWSHKSRSRINSLYLLTRPIVLLLCCTLDTAGPPRIDSGQVTSHIVTASVGETLRLVCPVSADPAAYIDWFKDGDAIHIGWERYRVRSHDSVLVVRDVHPSDAGFFQCTAVNGFGSVEYTFRVTVRPPRKYQSLPVPDSVT